MFVDTDINMYNNIFFQYFLSNHSVPIGRQFINLLRGNTKFTMACFK